MPHTQSSPSAYSLVELFSSDRLPAISAGYMVLLAVLSAMMTPLTIVLVVIVRLVVDLYKYSRMHSSIEQSIHGAIYENIEELSLLALAISFLLVCNSLLDQEPSGMQRTIITLMCLLGTTIPTATILHRTMLVLVHWKQHVSTICVPVFKGRTLYRESIRYSV